MYFFFVFFYQFLTVKVWQAYAQYNFRILFLAAIYLALNLGLIGKL